MSLHLLKLCVGATSIKDLEAWVEHQAAVARRLGLPPYRAHTTRMVPKRVDELLDGGSLYWVIKGQIAVRQRLVDIRPLRDAQGISRCDLVLEAKLHPVRMRPCRPFQGWRYLADADAPADMEGQGENVRELPESLRRELSDLGLM